MLKLSQVTASIIALSLPLAIAGCNPSPEDCAAFATSFQKSCVESCVAGDKKLPKEQCEPLCKDELGKQEMYAKCNK